MLPFIHKIIERTAADEPTGRKGPRRPRLQEESSSSEPEDSDGDLLNDKVEKKFFETIAAIRTVDKDTKDPTKQFFDEKDFETEGKEPKPAATKARPIYYKDLVRENALAEAEKSDGEDDKEENEDEAKEEEEKPKPETFTEEQKRLKNEFLDEVHRADKEIGEEELNLKKKEKTAEEVEQEQKDFESFVKVFLNLAIV